METVTVDGSGGTDWFYEPMFCGASAVYEYYIGQGPTPLTRIYKYRQPLKRNCIAETSKVFGSREGEKKIEEKRNMLVGVKWES